MTVLWWLGILLVLCALSSADTENGVIALKREERFPSVQQRVELYASNWYHKPCDKNDRFSWKVKNTTLYIDNKRGFVMDVIPDQTFYLRSDIIQDCARDEEDNATLPTSSHIQFRHNMRMYCVDAVELMELVDYHVSSSSSKSSKNVPVLIQFGDMKTSHIYGTVELPHFKKFRSAATSPEALNDAVSSCQRTPLDTVHTSDVMQPIVWKLATHRHYRHLTKVFRHDTPWDEKQDKAIFRGQLTGMSEIYDRKEDPLSSCRKLRRCRLVLETHNSTYIDAKLSTTRNRLPTVLNGVPLVGSEGVLTIREMMQFKGIIMLEGNDVASGLKWALLSQSVVLMPPPKHTSWAMEELLEPWIHYIPLKEDASDVEEKMRWVVQNDERAQQIAYRGTLWMEDLSFHPHAMREERQIKEELLQRYFAHFVAANDSRSSSKGGKPKKTRRLQEHEQQPHHHRDGHRHRHKK